MAQLPGQAGLYLSATSLRQAEFQSACAELFGRLMLAQEPAEAQRLLAGNHTDLLVIDLDGFEASIDLPALEALLSERRGARTLLLCPWDRAGWLPPMLRFGGVGYAVSPLGASELAALVTAELADASGTTGIPAVPDPAALQQMLGAQAAFHEALAGVSAAEGLLERVCAAMAQWPGVIHAAVFQLGEDGCLRLAGQHGPRELDVNLLPQRQQDVGRRTMPGQLAVLSGQIVLMDEMSKACEPELAQALRQGGAQMALALPVEADGPGAPRGVLCLQFGEPRQFGHVELAALAGLAHLARVGLQVDALRHQCASLQEKVAQVVTTDALTGTASRRHGEVLLEQEVRRARRHELPLVLLAFDIDDFRHVNHQFGLPVGDIVLRAVADTVRAQLRSHDVLVRSGSEEFQVIVPHIGGADGVRLGEKLRAALASEAIPGCDRITVSVGVAELAPNECAGGLVLRADVARSRSKRGGGNRVELALH
jgi:diguanylate cyclase (GGDEF)-like protein